MQTRVDHEKLDVYRDAINFVIVHCRMRAL